MIDDEMKNELKVFLKEYISKNLGIDLKCGYDGDLELTLTLEGEDILHASTCVDLEDKCLPYGYM